MKKALVAYFSASGVTQRLAKTVAEAAGADLFEIEPVQKYTSEDLDWTDKKSRSTLEMNDPSSRPAIAEHVDHMDQYDTVFVGFPIWWYEAPRIIHTFLEEYDFTGKKIVLFATSGGSGFGNTVSELKPSAPNAVIVEGKVFHKATKREIAEWVKSIS